MAVPVTQLALGTRKQGALIYLPSVRGMAAISRRHGAGGIFARAAPGGHRPTGLLEVANGGPLGPANGAMAVRRCISRCCSR